MKKKISPFWFVVAALATWRATAILNYEGIAKPIRQWVGIDETKPPEEQTTFLRKLMHCFWCESVWVSGFVTLTLIFCPILLIPFALSAIAIQLQKVCDWLSKPSDCRD